MNFVESIKTAIKMVWAHKLRSALVMLGVSIGVIATAGTVAAGLSMMKSIEEQFARMGTDTFIVMRWSPIRWISDIKAFFRHRRPQFELSYLPLLEQNCPTCLAIAPTTSRMVSNISFGKKRYEKTVILLGTNEKYDDIALQYAENGRFISEDDVTYARHVCIIDTILQKELFGSLEPIGQTIKINGIPYVVIGILSSPGGGFKIGIGGGPNTTVVLPITTFLRQFSDAKRRLSFWVKPQKGLSEEAQDEVRYVLRSIRKLKPSDEDNFDIFDPQSLKTLWFGILTAIIAAIVAIAGMSLLVAGIGIMNVMFVSVTERTKEIGIRKACGATPNALLTQFTIEAVVLSTLGGIIGLGTLFPVIKVMKKIANFQITLSPYVILSGLIFSVCTGIIFGIIPARKAAKQPPADALRTAQ